MSKFLIGIAILVVSAFAGYVGGAQNALAPATGGLVHPSEEHFLTGLKAGTSDQLSISSTGAIVTTGNITSTTAASATSSFSVGCIQTYATSSATSIKMAFNTQATTSINGTINGVMLWKYGTCP